VANAIPKSTVTAKGDLLVATGASTPANLAVGADGSTLVANSASATGMAWAGPSVAAGKNAIINGGMDIWQRGTSATISSGVSVYAGLDRWSIYSNGATATIAQSTSLPSNSTARYSALITGNTGITTLDFTQRVESNTIYQYAGQVTYSAWIYNNTGASFTPTLYWGVAGAVDNFASISYPVTTVLQSCANGVWTKVTASTNISSLSNYTYGMAFDLQFPSGSLSSNSKSINITQVQLELGSVATTFSRAGGTLQGELSACQRYYWQSNQTGTSYTNTAYATALSSTQADALFMLPTTMRIPPTVFTYSTVVLQQYAGASQYNVTAGTASANDASKAAVRFTVASGLSTGTIYLVTSNSTTSNYVAFSAEL
jgi:hypothetical protein